MLTHINENGEAVMVDVTDKSVTERTARASGRIYMNRAAFDEIVSGTVPKGDVFAAARIAGIMAAKKTSELIPLCHTLMLTKVTVDITPIDKECCILCECTVKLTGKTGAEMEALTGVDIALLTIYDMCKAADKHMTMTDIRLEEKDGGRSG
ncbi:MAG: cyclic pyranopterin monophosphate synthase MoaC, partial [Oscillospiraceae bacterium]|nr:cyclic pyranopterin monophosphate synthase MoaC [Oscillospiraceae bacterium]